MTYQVNLSTNSGDGFTDEELEKLLRERADAVAPPLIVKRSENDCLELHDDFGLLVTLCPAGSEPYDYLLVDFVDRRGWDEARQLEVVADIGERLDLSVLELESRLEYSPRQWAAIRGRYHSPDPARRTEARLIELDREIEFYVRRGLPYTPEETELLRSAVAHTDDAASQKKAQEVRDRKKREDRPVTPPTGRRYTDRPPWRWPWSARKV